MNAYDPGWVSAWIGLAGVLAGAFIALAGQRLAYRSQARDTSRLLVLEQCAHIVALSEDYRNRLWEERQGLASDKIAGWDLPSYRLAEARLRILAPSSRLLAALENLDESGSALGRLWRGGSTESTELDPALAAHRASIEAFIMLSSRISLET
jgi:hypothetical protein